MSDPAMAEEEGRATVRRGEERKVALLQEEERKLARLGFRHE